MPVCKPNDLINTLVKNIKAYHEESGVTRAELDLSDGINSAVVAGLLTIAVGANNITTIFLGINSHPDAYFRARQLADLMSQMQEAGYDMDEVHTRVASDPTILGSIRSTLRAPWGRAANRLSGGGIRHGTGNECEDRWLRFQKGGEVDTNPISMLSKTEIYQIAYALGRRFDADGGPVYDAFKRIIDGPPSADLWGIGDNHNDQGEIVRYLGVSGYPYGSVFEYGYESVEYGLEPMPVQYGTKYRSVGLIERVSRFLDRAASTEIAGITFGDILFQDEQGPMVEQVVIEKVVTAAIASPEFVGIAPADVDKVLRAARRVERQTRHKMNPNCPALTTRQELLDAGILTNDLPV